MGTKRFEWERAVLSSYLPPPARLIGLTLATRVDSDLTIPAKYSPSLTRLELDTGLSRSAVGKHLTELERNGWLRRSRPTTAAALGRQERTRYALLFPDNQCSTSTSAPDALGTATQEPGASTPHALGLVREEDRPSASGVLKPALTTNSSYPAHSAADATGSSSRTSETGPVDNDEDFEDQIQWIAEQLGPLALDEESYARGMLRKRSNRIMVRNTLNKRRGQP